MKFLVDECLSPKLTELAHERGYGGSSHVVWLGRSGAKDWDLLPLIVEGDWTFVTRNSPSLANQTPTRSAISFNCFRTA